VGGAFISSLFVPVASMPAVLQDFARVNPFTITGNAMRGLWLGLPTANHVWGAAAWAVGITAVFAPLAVARYRRHVRT
jgi:ABC-2 type transport system permease protein